MTSGKRLALAVGIGLLTAFGSLSAAQAQYRGQRPYYGAPPPAPRGVYRSGLVLGGAIGRAWHQRRLRAAICGGGGHGRGPHRRHGQPAPGADGRCLRGCPPWDDAGRSGRPDHSICDVRAAVLGRPTSSGSRVASASVDICSSTRTTAPSHRSATRAASARWAAAGVEVVQSYNFALDLQARASATASYRVGGDVNNVRVPGRRQLVLTGLTARPQPRARAAEHDACGSSSGASRSSPATRVRSLTRSGGAPAPRRADRGRGAGAGARGRAARVRLAVPLAFVRARARLAGGARRAPGGAASRRSRPRSRPSRRQEIEGTVVRGAGEHGDGRALDRRADAASRAPRPPGRWRCPSCRGWPDFGPGETRRVPRAPARAARNAQPRPARSGAGPARRRASTRWPAFAEAAAITRIAEPDGDGPRRIAFLARRALRAAIDRGVDRRRGGVPEDRRARRPPRHRRRRRGGIPRRRRDPRAVGLGAASGGRGDAAVRPRARAAATRVPRLPLYVDPRAVAAAVALPGDRVLRAGDRRSDRDAAVGADAVDRHGRLPGRPAGVARAGDRRGRAGAAGREPAAAPRRVAAALARVGGRHRAGRARHRARAARPAAGVARRVLAWLWRFIAAPRSRPPRRRRRSWRITSARWRRCRRWETWRWCRSSSWLSSRSGLAGAAAGAIWPPLGRLPLAAAGFAARAALAVADGFRAHAPLWLCRTPNALETAALTGGRRASRWSPPPSRGPARRRRGGRRAGRGAAGRRQPGRPRLRAAARARSDRDVPGRRPGGRRRRRGTRRRACC